jgi:DNA-binding transcriptional LysR family regulator
MVRIERYRAFVLVAETGDLGDTARRLGRTRRAVRRDLAGLEGAAGIRLLERRPRWSCARLTAAGEAFLPYAHLVVEAYENVAARTLASRSAAASIAAESL